MRRTCRVTEGRFIEHLHMTSRQPYWCSKTIQRWPFRRRKSCWTWTPCHVKAMNLPKLTSGFFSFSPRDTHVTFPFFSPSVARSKMVVVVNVRPKAKRRKNSLDEPNQARIHTSFHRFTEICQIFYNKYIFIEKKTLLNFPSWNLENGWTVSKYPVWMTQKLRKGNFREFYIKNIFPGEHDSRPS